jgi:acetyl esterase/lipase
MQRNRGSLGLAALVLLASGGVAAEPVRTRDVVYGRKDGLALTLDVFRPDKANGAGVVLIVSAGFTSSPESFAPAYAKEFLKRGYTVFAVFHGSQPRYTIPEIRDDVHRAVRFIRAHAEDYAIDPERLGAAGLSSGGLMALSLGTAPRPGDPKARDPVERQPSTVRAVVCFFPPTDYLNYGRKGNELLDLSVHPASFRAAYDFHEFDAKQGVFVPVRDKDKYRAILRDLSPIYHVTARSAPTLLIHGDKDELVPLQQSESLLAKLKEAGVPAELVTRKGEGHGWLTILSDAGATADWFDRYLAPKAEKKGPDQPRK